MADDLAGLKTTLSQTFTALQTDQGVLYGNEALTNFIRQFYTILKAKAVANGVTGI